MLTNTTTSETLTNGFYYYWGLRLALSNGTNIIGVSHPLTWGRKQIQFPKRCGLWNMEGMGKVQKPSISSVIHHRPNPFQSTSIIVLWWLITISFIKHSEKLISTWTLLNLMRNYVAYLPITLIWRESYTLPDKLGFQDSAAIRSNIIAIPDSYGTAGFMNWAESWCFFQSITLVYGFIGMILRLACRI
jgi:hypothetical protein